MPVFSSINLRKYIYSNKKIIRQNYPMNTEGLESITVQICKAISYLHGLKPFIVHADIKPDNILINNILEIKLCDFGVSKFSAMIEPFNTTVGRRSHGTKTYMSPEILVKKEECSTYSDMWALGVTIFELWARRYIWPQVDLADQDYVVILESIYENEVLPDLTDLGECLSENISQCLLYFKEDRISIFRLLQNLS